MNTQVHIVNHTYFWLISENQEMAVFKSGHWFKIFICIIFKLIKNTNTKLLKVNIYNL